jgi:ribosomal protein S4E
MNMENSKTLSDGDLCKVIAGTHVGKAGIVRDKHTSKTGHITITVEQKNGVRFKTLAKNVIAQRDDKGLK